MSDPVESVSKAADSVFKHLHLILRHLAPGYVCIASFYFSIARWPDKENLNLMLGLGVLLGMLIYALCKATITRWYAVSIIYVARDKLMSGDDTSKSSWIRWPDESDHEEELRAGDLQLLPAEET